MIAPEEAWERLKRFLRHRIDANPYDVTSDYIGPGTYGIVIEENGGGGNATISNAELYVLDAQCDLGCTGVLPGPPPVADGVVGTSMTLNIGVRPNELTVNIDDVTCSDEHAVVLYGAIGDFSDYKGLIRGHNFSIKGNNRPAGPGVDIRR